jgi:multiple sugar transport system permease protein
MGPLPGRVPIATASVTGPALRRQIVPRAVPVEERRRRLLMAVANHSIAIVISAVFVLPFIFILLTALMTQQQALTTHLWPSPFQWRNFARVFTEIPLIRYTYSTLVYAVLATIGVVA